MTLNRKAAFGSPFFCLKLMRNAQRVLFVCEIISKFVVQGGYTLGGHIESVFAVLNRKCGSFQNERMTNSTHFLYMYGVYWHILCRCLTHYRCGALYRLFSFGSFHNPLFDKRESSPHFLFLLLKPYRGCMG